MKGFVEGGGYSFEIVSVPEPRGVVVAVVGHLCNRFASTSHTDYVAKKLLLDPDAVNDEAKDALAAHVNSFFSVTAVRSPPGSPAKRARQSDDEEEDNDDEDDDEYGDDVGYINSGMNYDMGYMP